MNEPRHQPSRSTATTAVKTPARTPRAECSLGTLLVLFAAVAPFGCSNCNGNQASKLHRQAAPFVPEGPPRQPPSLPGGQPLSGEVFRKFAPDNIAGYVAEGPGEVLSAPLANGGTLTTFSRNYKRGTKTLRLEYSDGLHAPLLAKVIEQQQGVSRKTDLNEFNGTKVSGHPAVLQFQSNSRTAYANVLIAGRLLLNARVIPADDIQAAVEVAAALPLADVAALVPAPDGGTVEPAAEPAEPPEQPSPPADKTGNAKSPADRKAPAKASKPAAKSKNAPSAPAPAVPSTPATKQPG